MSYGSQLRQEAAQLRGLIDRRGCFIFHRIESQLYRVRALARSPAALPVAFICGIMAERLRVPCIKWVHGFLAGLGAELKVMQIISSLIGLSGR